MDRADFIEVSLLCIKYILLLLAFRKWIHKYCSKHIMVLLWGILLIRLCVPRIYSYSFRLPNGLIHLLYRFAEGESAVAERVYFVMDHTVPYFYRWLMILLPSFYILATAFHQLRTIAQSNRVWIQDSTDESVRALPVGRSEGRRFRKVRFYVNEHILYPITYGFFRPKVVLPASLMEEPSMAKLALEHEMTHIRHWDALYGHFINIVFCLHIFNPLVWVLCHMARQDLEIRCDERTLDRLGEEYRIPYMEMMLFLYSQQHLRRQFSSGFFAMNPTKERMAYLRMKRGNRGAGAVVALLCVVLGLTSFATVELGRDPLLIEEKGSYSPYCTVQGLKESTQDRREGAFTEHSTNREERVVLENEKRSCMFQFGAEETAAFNTVGVLVKDYKTTEMARYVVVFYERGKEADRRLYRGRKQLYFANLTPRKNYAVEVRKLDGEKLECIFTLYYIPEDIRNRDRERWE